MYGWILGLPSNHLLRNANKKIKSLKQRYIVNGERVSLSELYRLAAPIQDKKGFFA